MHRTPTLVVLAFAAAAGCAGVRSARFADKPIIREVADDAPTRLPEKRPLTPVSYAEALGTRGFVAAFDPLRIAPAADVNALDEVPRSTWFAEPAGGPLGAIRAAMSGPPEPPFTLLSRLPESGRNGVVVVDARGLRYELGRDVADLPYLRTGAAVTATHLVRALGYRAPEVTIIKLHESDLRPTGVGGQRPPIEALRAFLDQGPLPDVDGRYRATATRWPVGIDLGPTPPHGFRDDDDNDLVGHEDRRTLRALKVVRAWLSFPGLGADTLRDVYVGSPGKGHVEHFVVGLEGALGADISKTGKQEPRARDPYPDPTRGHDPLHQLITLGLGDRQRESDPHYPALGAFSEKVTDDDYDANIVFAPTYEMLPQDGYWAAKRIAAVGDDAIRAAIEAAEFPDAATRERLFHVLVARREFVVARAFAEVTPCEVQAVDRSGIVLRDLGYSRTTPGRFVVNFVDDSGNSVATPRLVEPNGALFTLPVPDAPYVIVRLTVRRGTALAPRSFEAHFRRRGPELQLVGVRH